MDLSPHEILCLRSDEFLSLVVTRKIQNSFGSCVEDVIYIFIEISVKDV